MYAARQLFAPRRINTKTHAPSLRVQPRPHRTLPAHRHDRAIPLLLPIQHLLQGSHAGPVPRGGEPPVPRGLAPHPDERRERGPRAERAAEGRHPIASRRSVCARLRACVRQGGQRVRRGRGAPARARVRLIYGGVRGSQTRAESCFGFGYQGLSSVGMELGLGMARPGVTLSLGVDRRVGVPAMPRAGGDVGAAVSRSLSLSVGRSGRLARMPSA